ncbi:3-oxoacyl-ACP reductase FabG [Uliginosibacterium sp. H3]|uniref:3-oxoacyl-ACP reductase FabG n=1 Tax=Uliginosibacterium silvisoli TaxID=3114758 RepID=A0ABU6JZC5_9RHOO|nr:3-oxoacyl-ACP reductase FabG [Uliginosibacterium sp. H3]
MKRALVTGGSGAIGSAVCRALAVQGHHVIVHANSNAARAETLAAELRAQGHSAEAVSFDVTDTAACESALAALVEVGPIQILVNNAGIHDDGVFAGMNHAQWSRVVDVSLNGFFNVTQPLMLPMIRTRWGRIVNMSSVAAITGNRGQVNYSAAKGALQSATRALSLEVASRGVTVNAVAPGIIASEMTEGVFDKETIDRMVPVKRAGTADEVAALVAFLASDASAYITGQTISINGGMA